ncbi:MAG TPA: hypothetical protein ENJ31_10445 [Anaerolineae bacterium]|nr:hypothetical protein [Anaerolineae bacterium]
MSKEELSPEERAARGKRLLIYGMFALLVVTFVSVFLSTYLLTGRVVWIDLALKMAVIITGIDLVASVIVWFIYTKAILKE